jgi:hypothetical protein
LESLLNRHKIFSDLVHQVNEEALLANWHQPRLKTVLEFSAEKLTTSVANEAKIRDLEGKEDFMPEEDVKAEEIKFRLKVMKAKAMKEEILSIIKSKSYMSKDDLKLKKDQEEKEEQQCHNCSVKYPVAQLSKGSNCRHIFCNNCCRPGANCRFCLKGLNGFNCNSMLAMGK